MIFKKHSLSFVTIVTPYIIHLKMFLDWRWGQVHIRIPGWILTPKSGSCGWCEPELILVPEEVKPNAEQLQN